MHELATNAPKHGAFSKPGGKVAVTIASANGALTITGQESGGPSPSAPNHEGYGLHVLKTAIARELGGSADVSFPAGGLRCVITVPLEKVSA